MESSKNRVQLTAEQKKRILLKLTQTETFERYLHTRYVAQKRFSVEGGDNLIPMLDCIIQESAKLGASDLVVGMAHRGRLNVLTNIFGKKSENMFLEFEGIYATDHHGGEGDVKYHMGYSSDYPVEAGSVHLSLASNPSHLEFVNPVVLGMARAKQRKYSKDVQDSFNKVVPITIHGDAAFAGQGIVYETIQLSLLNGYAVGGTVHIVVNNQVGFTTSPVDSRSTTYATDLAKMLETPIFHVNGDDAEACYAVSKLATEFRQKFHRDVVIDLICYRKYGHNEGDEPTFTQPLMYKKIKEHPSPREVYASFCAKNGSISEAEAQSFVTQENERLAAAHAKAKATKEPASISVFEGVWKGLKRATDDDIKSKAKTNVEEQVLLEIGNKLNKVPTGFQVHPKLVRVLEQRVKSIETKQGIDWGTGEALAFGSLLIEGTHVRITGQDAERGTFSHRHSVLSDHENGNRYTPLNHIRSSQEELLVVNSSLSEAAVLGYEYGHSIADPKALTIWEAQFGDFANGAQVIIDQFISSSESKWQRLTGLVMLLPHGYEGQGPEHSSARLERFLQLCAKNNIQVCNLTTPAQIFHALRRQVRRDFRKPLVIMSPKSLLRHPQAISTLDEFTKGGFQEVIDDLNKPKKAKKILFCSGKIYYELLAARESKGLVNDVAIIRLEQLYPWPQHLIDEVLKQYTSAKEICWVQEEPRNMGSWFFVREWLEPLLKDSQKLKYVGRANAAAPAVGSPKVHEKEQKALIEEAF